MNNKVIFIFLDGVGVTENNQNNPFAFGETKFLSGLIGGPIVSESACAKAGVIFKGIDACLGVPGIPQSATGQTAIFTGLNAPKLLGYHFPAFPNDGLKRMIQTENLFSASSGAGKSSTFANAYSTGYFKLVEEGKRKHSVTTISVISAGLSFRGERELAAGKAVYWDITNKYLKEHFGLDIREIEPEEAGKNLVMLAGENDLVVFECFLPDLIGHGRSIEKAESFCALLDRFVRGAVENMAANATLLISSDHGNFEDLSVAGHTTNPAILISIGPCAESFGEIKEITEIKSVILSVLQG